MALRYDLLNHLVLQHRYLLRSRTVEKVAAILNREDARVVDLCCGTGDLTMVCTQPGASARE
ncbi:MAG: class I SAM-dependent methyltransferase [Bryobacteraceae bacterium]